MNSASLPFDPPPAKYPDWVPPTPPSLDGIKEIFFDCETTGLKWWENDVPVGCSLMTPDGRKWYLPWAHKGGGNLCEKTMKRWALTELKGKRITGANTKFDVHMFHKWGVDLEAMGCEVSDVQHYAALLDDFRRQFSLEVLGQEFLQKGKIAEIKPEMISEMHAGDVAEYAERDVELVKDLVAVMYPMMEEQDLHRVRQLEDEVIFPVCEMERNACPMNVELLEKWKEEIEGKFHNTIFRIMGDTGLAINPKSSKDMAKLFDNLELEVQDFTDKGQPSYTDEALKKFNHPILETIRKAKRLKELLDKYLTAYSLVIGDDHLLRYQLHQLRNDEYGTVRGRFSASKVNIQAVMDVENQEERYGPGYVIRELFIPESGRFLAADAAQIEYRLFANYAAPPRILAEYEKDPRISFHEVVWDMVKKINPDIKYKALKNLNFAKLYGAGLARIAKMIKLPRRESDGFVFAYDTLFPEMAQLLNRAQERAEKVGYVRTILGRRARFRDKKKYHAAVNNVIQGTAAEIMKKKLVELFRKRKELCFKMRFTVHDEVCGDIPDEEHAKKVGALLDVQSFDFKVPILWDVKTGRNWAECH